MLFCLINAIENDEKQVDLHIKHTFSQFPDQVFSLNWCKKDKEVMIALSMSKIMYISKDKGRTWTSMKNKLEDALNRFSNTEVISIFQNKNDENTFIFIGEEGYSWYTQDCAETIYLLAHGRNFSMIKYHPTHKNWILASSWKECKKKYYSRKKCYRNKE